MFGAQRERQLGTGYGFGVFVEGVFTGEVNLNSIQRGPFQNAYIGYWIDEAQAGNAYVPEAFVVVLRFCFEELRLHRVQAAIVPRNSASRRVARSRSSRRGHGAELSRDQRSLEDHVRYAITAEDWAERGEKLTVDWIG